MLTTPSAEKLDDLILKRVHLVYRAGNANSKICSSKLDAPDHRLD